MSAGRCCFGSRPASESKIGKLLGSCSLRAEFLTNVGNGNVEKKSILVLLGRGVWMMKIIVIILKFDIGDSIL